MKEEIRYIDNEKYLSTKAAAALSDYTADYISQLCRDGELDAKKIERSWYVKDISVKEYVAKAKRKEKARKQELSKKVSSRMRGGDDIDDAGTNESKDGTTADIVSSDGGAKNDSESNTAWRTTVNDDQNKKKRFDQSSVVARDQEENPDGDPDAMNTPSYSSANIRGRHVDDGAKGYTPPTGVGFFDDDGTTKTQEELTLDDSVHDDKFAERVIAQNKTSENLNTRDENYGESNTNDTQKKHGGAPNERVQRDGRDRRNGKDAKRMMTQYAGAAVTLFLLILSPVIFNNSIYKALQSSKDLADEPLQKVSEDVARALSGAGPNGEAYLASASSKETKDLRGGYDYFANIKNSGRLNKIVLNTKNILDSVDTVHERSMMKIGNSILNNTERLSASVVESGDWVNTILKSVRQAAVFVYNSVNSLFNNSRPTDDRLTIDPSTSTSSQSTDGRASIDAEVDQSNDDNMREGRARETNIGAVEREVIYQPINQEYNYHISGITSTALEARLDTFEDEIENDYMEAIRRQDAATADRTNNNTDDSGSGSSDSGSSTYLGLSDTSDSFIANAIPFVSNEALTQTNDFTFDGTTFSIADTFTANSSTTKVGIGTSSPWGKFGIEQDNESQPRLVVGSSTASNLFISASGNVGIGTTTPGAPSGMNEELVIRELSGSSDTMIGFAHGNDQFKIGINSSNNGAFELTNGQENEFVSIDTSGNVGIGEKNPQEQLHLSDTLRIDNEMKLSSFTNSGPSDVQIEFTGESSSNTGIFLAAQNEIGISTVGNERLRFGSGGNIGIGSTTPWARLSIEQDDEDTPRFTVGSSTATNLFVDMSGNVGIATTSPTTAANASSTLAINGAFFVGGDNPLSTSTVQHNLRVKGTLQTGDLSFANNFYFTESDLSDDTPNRLYLKTPAGTTSIAVDESGKVGIATTTPDYDLHVDGDVAADSFINTSTETAKKDIKTLSTSSRRTLASKIRDIEVTNYRYKSESSDKPLRLGLIAEDAPKEILSASGKGVDLYKLSSLTIAGVQELDLRLEDIEERVAALEENDMSTVAGGSLVANVADAVIDLISAGRRSFNRLVTDQLCVGTTCVTESQLKELLDKNGVPHNTYRNYQDNSSITEEGNKQQDDQAEEDRGANDVNHESDTGTTTASVGGSDDDSSATGTLSNPDLDQSSAGDVLYQSSGENAPEKADEMATSTDNGEEEGGTSTTTDSVSEADTAPSSQIVVEESGSSTPKNDSDHGGQEENAEHEGGGGQDSD